MGEEFFDAGAEVVGVKVSCCVEGVFCFDFHYLFDGFSKVEFCECFFHTFEGFGVEGVEGLFEDVAVVYYCAHIVDYIGMGWGLPILCEWHW